MFDGQPFVSPRETKYGWLSGLFGLSFVLHHLGSVSRVHVFRMNWNASVNDKARFDHPFVLEKRLVLNLTKRGILHNHQIGALAAQLLEMDTPGFVEYSKAVVSNAGTMAKALIAKGHKLAIGGTTNHLVLWDLRPYGPAKSNVKKVCEACLDDDACISLIYCLAFRRTVHHREVFLG